MKSRPAVIQDMIKRYKDSLALDGRDDGFGNVHIHDDEEFLADLISDYKIVMDEDEIRSIFSFHIQ